MHSSTTVEQIIERTERLLARHDELRRTNALLSSELKQVRTERDLLKARVDEARQRIDALLSQLPQPSAAAGDNAQEPRA